MTEPETNVPLEFLKDPDCDENQKERAISPQSDCAELNGGPSSDNYEHPASDTSGPKAEVACDAFDTNGENIVAEETSISLENTCILVSVLLRSGDEIWVNAVGKLLPVLAKNLVVSEQSIWIDEIEIGRSQKFLIVNILTSDETQRQNVISRINSDSFLTSLNKSCDQLKIFHDRDDATVMRFESVSTPFSSEIPIIDDWMCSESHKVRVDDKKRYFSCMGCKRYVMGQSSIHCRECSRYYNALQRYNIGQSSLYCGRKSLDKKNFRYCLDCKNVNEDIDSGWFSFCNQNWMIQCVLTSFLLDFFRRLVPLLQAMWVQADVILDGRQTWTYYKHAQPNDSDYAKWADDYMKETNSTHKHTVSEAYFETGMAVWLLTPTLCALFPLVGDKEPLSVFNMLLDKDFLSNVKNSYLKVILLFMLLPIDILGAGVIIYAFIPAASLKRAFKILLKHEFTHVDDFFKVGGFTMDSRSLPFMKGFEFIGEATPQLILAIIFIANNHEFMLQNFTVFGIPELYITLISMIFSVGSIAMGLYSAISAFGVMLASGISKLSLIRNMLLTIQCALVSFVVTAL